MYYGLNHITSVIHRVWKTIKTFDFRPVHVQ